MLRTVENCSILVPAHYISFSFRLVRQYLPSATEPVAVETSPASEVPQNSQAPPSQKSTKAMAPVEEPRRIPNLISGAAMNPDQVNIFQKLSKLVDSTLHHRQTQISTKDANTISGAAVAHQHPSFFSSECIRRYLVSRQFCEKKAYEMMMSTLFWRTENVPLTFQPADYHECTSSRFMEWHGYDGAGRPTLYMKSANANLKIPRDTRVKFSVVTLEKGVKLMERGYSGHNGVEQWNIVVDETGRGSEHTDNKFLSHIAPILTSHYAQRLHRCYVVNPGLMTRMIYGIVKMFLDEGTTSKIKMVSSKKDKKRGVHFVPELLEDIGAANLPVEYGGTLPPRLLEEYREYFNSIPLK